MGSVQVFRPRNTTKTIAITLWWCAKVRQYGAIAHPEFYKNSPLATNSISVKKSPTGDIFNTAMQKKKKKKKKKKKFWTNAFMYRRVQYFFRCLMKKMNMFQVNCKAVN